MESEKLSPEDLRNLVNNITSEVLRKLTQSSSAEQPLASAVIGLPLPFDCQGTEFICGKYVCTGIVACGRQTKFGCTIEFTGFNIKAPQS